MPFLPENIQLSLRRLGEQGKGGLTGLMLRLALVGLGEMMEAELVSRAGPRGNIAGSVVPIAMAARRGG